MSKYLICLFSLIFLYHAVDAATISPLYSATITDENGDGSPDSIGLGFGHPDAPNYGTTLVQFQPGVYERLTIFEFSLSSIPSSVATGVFQFSLSASVNILSASIYTFAGDGQITLSDFSTSGTLVGSASAVSGLPAYRLLDITESINLLRQNGADYMTIRIEASDRSSISSGSVGSSYGPALQVTPVPEASTIAMLLLGIVLVIFFKFARYATAREKILPNKALQ